MNKAIEFFQLARNSKLTVPATLEVYSRHYDPNEIAQVLADHLLSYLDLNHSEVRADYNKSVQYGLTEEALLDCKHLLEYFVVRHGGYTFDETVDLIMPVKV